MARKVSFLAKMLKNGHFWNFRGPPSKGRKLRCYKNWSKMSLALWKGIKLAQTSTRSDGPPQQPTTASTL